jgi:hypothetical protein
MTPAARGSKTSPPLQSTAGSEFNRGTVWRRQSVGGSPPGTLTITINTAGDIGRISARARSVIGLASAPFDNVSAGTGFGTLADPAPIRPRPAAISSASSA